MKSMIQKEIRVQDQGCGEVKVSSHIVQKNDALAAFNQLRRNLPPEERKKLQNVKIVGFYPFYTPTGMFNENECTLTLDPDQLDYMIREAPEFRSEHDPIAPGKKLIIHG